MSAPSIAEAAMPAARSKSREAASIFAPLAQPRFRRSLTSLIIALAVWELLGRFVLTHKLFFVPASSVAFALVELASDGTLALHAAASFKAIFYGMSLAVLFGISFGVLVGASRIVSDYTEIYLNALYSTPLVAIAPLLILWLGIGVESKIAVVFLISVFPIVISTAAGVRNVDRHFIDVARAFGGTQRQIVRKVLMPAALPFVLTGVRLAIGRAIVGVVVGELFGANAGLGYLIYTSGQTFDVPNLFAGVFCLAFAGVSLTWALQALETRLVRWKPAPLGD